MGVSNSLAISGTRISMESRVVHLDLKISGTIRSMAFQMFPRHCLALHRMRHLIAAVIPLALSEAATGAAPICLHMQDADFVLLMRTLYGLQTSLNLSPFQPYR